MYEIGQEKEVQRKDDQSITFSVMPGVYLKLVKEGYSLLKNAWASLGIKAMVIQGCHKTFVYSLEITTIKTQPTYPFLAPVQTEMNGWDSPLCFSGTNLAFLLSTL